MQKYRMILVLLTAAATVGIHEANGQGMGASTATRLEDNARIGNIVAGDTPTKSELQDRIAKIDGLHGATLANIADLPADARQPFGADDKGVAVMIVDHDSKAWQNGLRPRDVIVAVDQHAVADMSTLGVQITPPRHNMVLAVKRGGEDVRITIP